MKGLHPLGMSIEKKIATGITALALAYATSALAITNDDRVAAATGTVSGNPACAALTPFYWEIGDQNGPVTSSNGSKSYGTGGTATFWHPNPPDPDQTTLNIYSAGKLVFGAYVVERRSGNLNSADLDYMRMLSGYPGNGPDSQGYIFAQCSALQTVNGCFNKSNNNYQDNQLPPSDPNYAKQSYHKFNYGGGHYEAFAALATNSGGLGLGSKYTGGLATEINSVLNVSTTFSYGDPGLAGGAKSTAHNYTDFLRAILSGQLGINALLGHDAICTAGSNCPYTYPAGTPAVITYTGSNGQPVQQTLQWHYSLGHWVEDDPADPIANDGAFSSAGAAGFYPWIDQYKQYYGVVARELIGSSSYIDSAQCGKLIRLAWTTGTVQSNPIPHPLQ